MIKQQFDAYPRFPCRRWFLPLVLAVIVIVSLVMVLTARAEEYSDTQIAEAIFRAEGGAKAQYAYGIRSVSYKTIDEARRICLNTIRNNRRRYADYGYKQFGSYLEFLASRYCPTKGKLSRAEKRVNKYWLKNVRRFLERG